MRYRLRTLMIVLALGPPIVAIGVREWLRFQPAAAAVAERNRELITARAVLVASKGSRNALAGTRHAQLRLAREDEAARRESLVYRVMFPVAPK